MRNFQLRPQRPLSIVEPREWLSEFSGLVLYTALAALFGVLSIASVLMIPGDAIDDDAARGLKAGDDGKAKVGGLTKPAKVRDAEKRDPGVDQKTRHPNGWRVVCVIFDYLEDVAGAVMLTLTGFDPPVKLPFKTKNPTSNTIAAPITTPKIPIPPDDSAMFVFLIQLRLCDKNKIAADEFNISDVRRR